MNEIKIYMNPSGSTAEVYKDFNLYQESYRNTQITLYVPTSLLYENADGALLLFAYADYRKNVYLGGESVDGFCKEFGFELTDEEKKILEETQK